MARRKEDLVAKAAQQEVFDKQMEAILRSVREAQEAGAKKKEEQMKQAHQERVVYLQTFYQRMRDYKSRVRKRPRQEQS